MNQKIEHSLLLVKLTPIEIQAFHKAKIPYSGSTGSGSPESYPRTGCYIATFERHLQEALRTLGWKKPHWVMVDNQLWYAKHKVRL